MRMTPVKTKPISRHIRVKFLMWGIALSMRRLWRDLDVWLTVSTAPADGSPWAQTRAYGSGVGQIDSGSVVHVAGAEAQLRLDAVHDYFVGLRGAMWTRSVYSLHALCRSTIEACAFAAWVFDPGAAPAERHLRGLMLREQWLDDHRKALDRMVGAGRPGELDVADIAQARSVTAIDLSDVQRVIEGVRVDLASMSGLSSQVPAKTQRVGEMLVDDMGMPQGADAYHRLSGVAHSAPGAIFGTWNLDGGRPSIDYYSFLEPLHLALCSIHFGMERRAICWGETHKDAGLVRIIRRLERILEGEPDVQLM